jgi:hypothetical protein
MKSSLARIFPLVALLVSPLSGIAQAEQEPNDKLENAVAIKLDTPVQGVWHLMDTRDCYRLKLPTSGIVTVTVDGFPSDCGLQVSPLGFQKYATSSLGAVDGKPGEPLTFRFAARGRFDGYIAVQLDTVASAVTGSGWGIVRCSADGPYYRTPPKDKAADKTPATHNGKPVGPAITYRLSVTYQELDDKYEHTDVVGLRYPDLLKEGHIKTIGFGREIEAYLFNEHPQLLRDHKLGIDRSGGENDIDVYHLKLTTPDSVRVTLRDLPTDANTQIYVYYPGGWKASKTGAPQFDVKIPNSGDVFVEIRKGDGDGPLDYSTKPYRLAVTRQSTGHVVRETPTEEPTPPGGVGPLRIQHNAGGRLQNGPILPRGEVRRSGPGLTLGELTNGVTGKAYDFEAVDIDPPEGALIACEWSFSDGRRTVAKTGNPVQYAFSTPGNHTVTVRVVDRNTLKKLGSAETTVSIIQK